MKTKQVRTTSTFNVRGSRLNVLLLLLSFAANAAELRSVLDGRYLNLSWEAPDGKLQEAATPNGPWQTVTTALCPYRTSTTSTRKFYRLILPAPGKKWLTVAAVTMNAKTNVATNLQLFFSYMEQAASNGVDLVVFPEIALQQCPAWGPASHTPTAQEMAYVRQTSETIPGQSTSNIVVKAKELNLFVVFGMTEKDQAGLLYNANVFLGPDGVLGKHRKRYLTGASLGANEDQIWVPGQVWDVVNSPIGKVGLLTCLEMAYAPGPILAGQGATLLVTSSAWSSDYRSYYEQYTTSNASLAQRWHVVSDMVGADGHLTSLGFSRVVDPQGRIVCDTGAMAGLVIWATDILIDARTP
jgi:predicted amidohydrolase